MGWRMERKMEEVKILFEDKDILVVVKPAGMASQEERSVDMDMVSYLKNYLVREKKVKGVPYIGVVHRLDKPVGGVMVYAKTQQAAGNLSEQIQKNRMTKEYLAVLTGMLKKKEDRLEDYLVSDGKKSTVVADKSMAGAKKAVLEYKVKRTKFENGKQYSLVNIHLITGRRHQIRVQMAHAGAGLWGDTKYNPDFTGQTGWFDLALFAWHLEFDHPRTRKHLKFEVPAGSQITNHFV
ncbi:MAG: RluA family pseudouridine synthase [Coprococcus sp.]